MEEIILINDRDEVIGFGEKLDVHRKKQLHRAFSVFIYDINTKTILLHQRANGKYHSGGLWTNSCCSHPRKGEELLDAVVRRIGFELGLTLTDEEIHGSERNPLITGLLEVGHFRYFADYGELAESEIDHVFYLPIKRDVIELSVDKEEIMDVCYKNVNDIKEEIIKHPEKFTAWFIPAFQMLCDHIQF